MSSNIQQLEITLALLEAKLQSVEGAGTTTPTASTTTTTTTTTTTEATGAPTPTGGPPPPPGGPVAGNTSEPEAAPAPPPAPSLTWRKDPRYSKFFSLLDMGVPLGQIQRDMMLKGMNPKILEYVLLFYVVKFRFMPILTPLIALSQLIPFLYYSYFPHCPFYPAFASVVYYSVEIQMVPAIMLKPLQKREIAMIQSRKKRKTIGIKLTLDWLYSSAEQYYFM